MAQIFQVNELPSAGSVNRTQGDVYWWYQTHETTYPFDPLSTPIDYGYYAVDPDIQWLLLTTEPHDLPVEFLERVTYASEVQTIDRTIPHKAFFSPVRAINGSYQKEVIGALVSSDIQSQEKAFQFAVSSPADVTAKKRVFFSAVRKASVTEKKYTFSTPTSVVFPERRKTFGSTEKIQVQTQEKVNIFSRAQIDVQSSEKLVKFSAPQIVNFPEPEPPIFAQPTRVNFTGKQYQFSQRTQIDFPDLEKVRSFSPVYKIDFNRHEKEYMFTSSEVKVNITSEKLKQFSDRRKVDIPKLTPFSVFSGTRAVNIPPTGQLKTFGPVATHDYFSAKKNVEFSPVNSLIPPQKLLEFSGMEKINILFEGGAELRNECDWILLKKLGVKNWRFFAVLDEMTESIIAPGASPDIRFHELLNASQTNTVIYNDDGLVDSVIYYTDVAKIMKSMEMHISYASGFPSESVTEVYDHLGIHYLTITETFVPNLAGDIESTGVTVDQIGVPGVGTVLPTDSSVKALNAVHSDSGVLFPASATGTREQATVIGFVFSMPTSSTGIFLQSGIINGFTSLVPGEDYFLSQTTPGEITVNHPPMSSGHWLKRVGVAISTTSLLIDVSQPLLYRTP